MVLPAASRIVSTQPLAAIEVMEGPGRLALATPESPIGTTNLTFPQGVIGQAYATTVTLVNLGVTANATVQFRGSSIAVPVPGNGVTVLDLNSLFPIPPDILADAVRVSTAASGGAILVGTVDIANPLSLVSMGTLYGAVLRNRAGGRDDHDRHLHAWWRRSQIGDADAGSESATGAAGE